MFNCNQTIYYSTLFACIHIYVIINNNNNNNNCLKSNIQCIEIRVQWTCIHYRIIPNNKLFTNTYLSLYTFVYF